MATTTNYGWTTPDDTALVKDGAAAIRTLGSSVDTTTKALNPSTTLGDVEYRSSTANTNTKLAIGTTGQVLTVAGGVPSWANPVALASGLTFISRTTFSAAATVDVDTIFSNTYENYLVCGQFISSSGNPSIQMQGRHGSTTITAGGYYYGLSKAAATGAIGIVQGSNDNSFTLCFDSSAGTQDSLININVYRKTTGNLAWTGTVWADNSYVGSAGAGSLYNSQTYTGLRFKGSSGTITGQVTVYGLAAS
jgi:hypothetical protein